MDIERIWSGCLKKYTSNKDIFFGGILAAQRGKFTACAHISQVNLLAYKH